MVGLDLKIDQIEINLVLIPIRQQLDKDAWGQKALQKKIYSNSYSINTSKSGNVNCFICGETFESKNEMMKHRKSKHYGVVKPCFKFSEKQCRFKDEICWFKHELNYKQYLMKIMKKKQI